jgi:hypothetical protein
VHEIQAKHLEMKIDKLQLSNDTLEPIDKKEATGDNGLAEAEP